VFWKRLGDQNNQSRRPSIEITKNLPDEAESHVGEGDDDRSPDHATTDPPFLWAVETSTSKKLVKPNSVELTVAPKRS
jgi:hypothetical protein